MKKILNNTKEFIHKLFILLRNITLFYISFCFGFFIVTIGTAFFYIVIEYILSFLAIDLSFLLLSLLYELGLPRDNTIYLFFIPIILFFMRPILYMLSKDDLKNPKEYQTIYNPFSQTGNIIYYKIYKYKK